MNIPYCLCAKINDDERSFYNDDPDKLILEFIEYLLSSPFKNMEIYIHNLNFDGFILINFFSRSKMVFNISSIKTNLYWIKLLILDREVVFRCSFKIIPISLRKIGEIEGCNKRYFPYKFSSKDNLKFIGEIPHENYWEDNHYNLYMKDKPADYIFNFKKESIEYCMHDVILLKKSLDKVLGVINSIDKGLLKKSYSAPSISHKIFFMKYNKFNIKEKLKKVDESFLRESYYGGRCEVFGNIYDDEYIKYYDFKGMYSQVMMEKFHVGDGYFTTKSDVDKVGFHKITYESNDYLPILPSHSEDGKLMFKNGCLTGTFWYEEILYFLKNNGKILSIEKSYVYNNTELVFYDFVKDFTKMRENGGYFNVFCKLLINSLYGSMGLKDDNTINYITHSYDEFLIILKDFNVVKYYSINSIFIIIIEKDYKFKSIYKNKTTSIDYTNRNVSYASAISSKARIKLHKMMLSVENDGGRVLYTDTDSIFAGYNKKDLRKNINDEPWLDFYDDGIFTSPKSYSVKNKDIEIVKIKGVSYKDISLNDLKYFFLNNKKILFNTQKINYKKDFMMINKNIEKEISFTDYDKRDFYDFKRRSKPLTHI